jgi:hypothetical protein
MVPTGPGRFMARNPRIPSRLAGLHPGLLSRRAYGAYAFWTIAPCTSPSTWWGHAQAGGCVLGVALAGGVGDMECGTRVGG